MTEVGQLFNVAVLGEQVDSFIRSDVGQYVVEHIEAEKEKCLQALKTVNPEDSAAIRQAQSDIRRAESMKDWLTSAIIAGLKAKDVLEEREDE